MGMNLSEMKLEPQRLLQLLGTKQSWGLPFAQLGQVSEPLFTLP